MRVGIAGQARMGKRTGTIIFFIVICCLHIVAFSQISKPAKNDNTVPSKCCTSMNYEKIISFSIVIAVAYAMLKVKVNGGDKGDKPAILLGMLVLLGMVTRIIITSHMEKTYSELEELGFWWHANWFTIGMMMALTLKAWQYSMLPFEQYEKQYAHFHYPWISTIMFSAFVAANLYNYHRNPDSKVHSWAAKTMYTLYPIGVLRSHGGANFVPLILAWNLLSIVEMIEGIWPTLLMLSVTLNANLR